MKSVFAPFAAVLALAATVAAQDLIINTPLVSFLNLSFFFSSSFPTETQHPYASLSSSPGAEVNVRIPLNAY